MNTCPSLIYDLKQCNTARVFNHSQCQLHCPWYLSMVLPKKPTYRLLEISSSVNVLRGCGNTDQENQNSILHSNHVMWNYTLSSPTALQLSRYKMHPQRGLFPMYAPRPFSGKFPDSLCLGIHRLKAKKRDRGRPHLSPLLAHPPTSAWLMGVQDATTQNLKFCRTCIHTYQLNEQKRLPNKRKEKNAKSRACLKALFLKIRLFPLFFTHC